MSFTIFTAVIFNFLSTAFDAQIYFFLSQTFFTFYLTQIAFNTVNFVEVFFGIKIFFSTFALRFLQLKMTLTTIEAAFDIFFVGVALKICKFFHDTLH